MGLDTGFNALLSETALRDRASSDQQKSEMIRLLVESGDIKAIAVNSKILIYAVTNKAASQLKIPSDPLEKGGWVENKVPFVFGDNRRIIHPDVLEAEVDHPEYVFKNIQALPLNRNCVRGGDDHELC